MGTLFQDLRYGLRMLTKNPGFTAVAVLTLALGIGANTAIFSIIDAVMLRPLPYPQPDRLVSVWENLVAQPPSRWTTSGTNVGTSAGVGIKEPSRMTVAPANLMDYRAQNRAFTGMAGFALTGMNLTGSGAPERLPGERVTSNYFSVLGIQPAQGRPFLPEEDRPGSDHVVIVSHELWRERFGADPRLIGSSLTLDGERYEVIGIMPPGFQAISQFGFSERLNIFRPAAYPESLLANHGDHEVNVVARLKPGVSLEQARLDMEAISDHLAKAYPDSNRNIRAGLAPLADDVVRNVRASLWALLGSVGLTLLIACTNVANLLLARSIARRREISVRFALGATRSRIVCGLLLQSAALALFGCAAGMLFGVWAKDVLVSLAPPGIPRLDNVVLSGRVLAFTIAASLATGILFGIFPAWQMSKTPPIESLRTSERNLASVSAMRWRSGLVVTEIALSMVLLIGAGLLLRSFVLLRGVDLGFQTERVLAMNINLPETRYSTAERRLAFFETLEARVVALPGVQSVGFANRMPLRGSWGGGLEVASSAGPIRGESDFQAVSPGYFATLSIPLLRGRLLAPDDRTGALPVAAVNTAFVRQFLGNEEPLGRRFRRSPQAPWITIVGIVGDVVSKYPNLLKRQPIRGTACTEIGPAMRRSGMLRSVDAPHLGSLSTTVGLPGRMDEPTTARRH